jgi:HPt (histidine-containing phosphotransfer) domain-containing protein
MEKIQVTIDPDLRELIPGFLENRARDAAKVKEALEMHDYETLKRLGHNMKGVGSGYGFDEITRLGAEIEQSAVSGDEAALRKLCTQLNDYMQRVTVVYI